MYVVTAADIGAFPPPTVLTPQIPLFWPQAVVGSQSFMM